MVDVIGSTGAESDVVTCPRCEELLTTMLDGMVWRRQDGKQCWTLLDDLEL